MKLIQNVVPRSREQITIMSRQPELKRTELRLVDTGHGEHRYQIGTVGVLQDETEKNNWHLRLALDRAELEQLRDAVNAMLERE